MHWSGFNFFSYSGPPDTTVWGRAMKLTVAHDHPASKEFITREMSLKSSNRLCVRPFFTQ
jgi:hypothetical protein